MHKAGFEVIVGTFKKKGIIYHAAITVPLKVRKGKTTIEYKVLLTLPGKKSISFNIKLDEHGRWIPDKRRQVDPWIANEVGLIIENKVIKSDGDTGN